MPASKLIDRKSRRLYHCRCSLSMYFLGQLQPMHLMLLVCFHLYFPSGTWRHHKDCQEKNNSLFSELYLEMLTTHSLAGGSKSRVC
mmetsp:Transcript_11919/g.17765  ORF Transcript_11919/g.17765 Transcript_11919/m.17765 type:complete len:86 (-) Transcript_11919:3136-3393(-)